MPDESNLFDEALDAVLTKLAAEAKVGNSKQALQLAEAYAWLSNPSQPHGSSTV